MHTVSKFSTSLLNLCTVLVILPRLLYDTLSFLQNKEILHRSSTILLISGQIKLVLPYLLLKLVPGTEFVFFVYENIISVHEL